MSFLYRKELTLAGANTTVFGVKGVKNRTFVGSVKISSTAAMVLEVIDAPTTDINTLANTLNPFNLQEYNVPANPAPSVIVKGGNAGTAVTGGTQVRKLFLPAYSQEQVALFSLGVGDQLAVNLNGTGAVIVEVTLHETKQ